MPLVKPHNNHKGGRNGGRPKGSRNRIPKAHLYKAQKVMKKVLLKLGPQAFVGDAHEFLCAVYKDPAISVDLRIEAAKAAVKYEKPALSSVDLGNKKDEPFKVEMTKSDADL